MHLPVLSGDEQEARAVPDKAGGKVIPFDAPELKVPWAVFAPQLGA